MDLCKFLSARRGLLVSWMLAAVFFLPCSAFAGLPGLDYLGLAKFCDAALEAHPTGAAVGAFLNVDGFGDASNCLKRFCDSGKTKDLRIHLSWDDGHKCLDAQKIEREATRLESVAEYCNKKGVRSFVSGQCEHNCDATKAKIHRAKALGKCRSCAGYVNTPWRGALIDGINEVHGSDPKKPGGRYFVSFDGTSTVDSDVSQFERKYSDSDIRFFWEPRFNGRWETNDNTPRPQRKGYPQGVEGQKLIRSLAYLWWGKGVTKLGKDEIYKSHSENKGNGDPRAEKPVAILKVKASRITLVGQSGKEISSAKYYGTFEGSRHRYYFPDWGFELAEKAKAASGSRLVTIRANGKSLGVINPAFRDGSFR